MSITTTFPPPPTKHLLLPSPHQILYHFFFARFDLSLVYATHWLMIRWPHIHHPTTPSPTKHTPLPSPHQILYYLLLFARPDLSLVYATHWLMIRSITQLPHPQPNTPPSHSHTKSYITYSSLPGLILAWYTPHTGLWSDALISMHDV